MYIIFFFDISRDFHTTSYEWGGTGERGGERKWKKKKKIGGKKKQKYKFLKKSKKKKNSTQ